MNHIIILLAVAVTVGLPASQEVLSEGATMANSMVPCCVRVAKC